MPQVTCTVSSIASSPYCQVGDVLRIDVLGDQFVATALYQVVITGLNNPPQSQGLTFTITSLYSSNIYLNE